MNVGTCHCHDVHFALKSDPLVTYICHCTECQAASGSAFSISCIVRRADIQVQRGEIATLIFETESKTSQLEACARCGSPLWFSNPEAPEMVAIKGGCLEYKSEINPVAQLWTQSAQPWMKLDPDLLQFETQPKLDELLALVSLVQVMSS